MDQPLKDDGSRPAGKPGVCFYCRRAGTLKAEDHAPDCVVPQRTVVLDVTIRYVTAVPRSWEPAQILFQRNDGSYCMDNELDVIRRSVEDDHQCLCGRSAVLFIREATEQDQREFGYEEQEG